MYTLRLMPKSAVCVRRFDDSRRVAIRSTYRVSLRSSSKWESRYPSRELGQSQILRIRDHKLNLIHKEPELGNFGTQHTDKKSIIISMEKTTWDLHSLMKKG